MTLTTQRTRAFVLLTGLVGAACATIGCELLVSFDRSLIDGGTEADGASPDGGQAVDGASDGTTIATDASDSSTPDAEKPDASDSSVPDASDAGDAGEHDAGPPDSGDAGCTSSSHCPVGEACDLATGVCTTTCSPTQECNGVCCNGTTCEPGDAATTCGLAGGMCANCVTADAGGVCVNGTCGCNTESNCPVGEACNAALHECVSSCSPSQVCNGTCCNGSTCANPQTDVACGTAGGTCSDCVTLDAGAACNVTSGTGTCGCNSATDCPTDFACDVATHTCTTSCSSSQACNGGCCSAATGGTCQASCAGNANGTACVSGVCGCSSTTDCACGVGGTDAGACSCTGTPGVCNDTEITSLTATATATAGTYTLAWNATGATTCSITGTAGSVPCTGASATLSVQPVGTTIYTLTATGNGGTTTSSVTIYCNAISDPASTACPTAATQFCELVPIVGTTLSQAEDACNACFGASTCTSDPVDNTNLGGGSAWVSPVASGSVAYVYIGGSSAAVTGCASPYTVLPGDITFNTATTCPAGRWAP